MTSIQKVLINTTNDTHVDLIVICKESLMDDRWSDLVFIAVNNALEMSDGSLVINYGDERRGNKGQATFAKGHWKCIKSSGILDLYPTGATQQVQEQDFNM